jgi:hypothetical protein
MDLFGSICAGIDVIFWQHPEVIVDTFLRSAHMLENIQRTIPDVELRCYVLGSMSMQQQIQVVEEASVHVSPQGGLSYFSLFAQEGASLVLLVIEPQRI